MWLALKSLYLWYLEQLTGFDMSAPDSCDLLSKVCTFGIWNNITVLYVSSPSVVTCSQKFVPLVSGTTVSIVHLLFVMLWLALKSLYLWYLEQRIKVNANWWWVVTCSQKFVPLVSGTTFFSFSILSGWLWLALKSLYLWYLEQRTDSSAAYCYRCDLLSKVCTFGIWNNWWGWAKYCDRLWLALKSLYLWYLEQRWSFTVSSRYRCDLLSKVCTFGIWNNEIYLN